MFTHQRSGNPDTGIDKVCISNNIISNRCNEKRTEYMPNKDEKNLALNNKRINFAEQIDTHLNEY